MKKYIAGAVLSVGLLFTPAFSQAALTGTQIQAILSLLSAFGADSATIANVNTALIKGGSTSTTPEQPWCHTFNTNLKIGDSDQSPIQIGEIGNLQIALNKEGFRAVDEHSSNFPTYFGDGTASATVGFQEKYANDILAPVGLQHGTGYVGPSTRAKLNSLYGCNNSQPTTPRITSVLPSSGPVGTIATLEGYFPNGAAINFDGQSIGQIGANMHSYSFIIPNTIKAQGFGAPPTVSVYPGEHSISLVAGSSMGNSVKFTVTSTIPTPPPTGAPTVTSVSPSEITVGATKEVTIHGSNFSSRSMIAMIGSGMVTSIGPARISPDGTSMTFSFPEALTVPALYSVDVYTVGDVPDYTHGGPRIYNSTAVVTLVNPYTPAITSISPTSGSVGRTVTILGSNFYGDSRVSVGTWLPSVATDFGPITISSYTNTSLSFIVPSSMSPGKYVISVAGSAEHRSNKLTFTVVAQ